MSKTESDLIERHFRSAGYRDASEDHGHPGWVWSGVARPVPAVADLAGTTTLTAELSAALDGVRGPRPRHEAGRMLVDLAVAIADGAEAISDIAVLADQPALFGSVASDSTCWRLLDALGDPELAAVAAARAREVAWAQRAETTGAAFGPSRVADTAGVEALVIDLDGHIVVCHSEKEQAAPTFKHTFGLSPGAGVLRQHRGVPRPDADLQRKPYTGSAADLYATLQPHRPHQPRNQRPHERAEQVLVPLGAPVRYRKVLGSVINEAPPCRVNDSMKLQVRHHHEFEAVHAGISHEAQGLTDTVLCPPAIEASPSMSRRIRRGLR